MFACQKLRLLTAPGTSPTSRKVHPLRHRFQVVATAPTWASCSGARTGATSLGIGSQRATLIRNGGCGIEEKRL